ncbi:hypothetical protein DFJ63DRAFT_336050 [Scheffersomyces coipomensis]|uniref:uncharacterized protein n=1 Tax=Scheffersomyces coipomensis TaxID=1788519 RepID=UPI00315DBFC5
MSRSSFYDSFWTSDYESGFRKLFDQLQGGIQENDSFIQLVQARIDSEYSYGSQLNASDESIKKRDNRLYNDEFISTTKTAFQIFNENFKEQGSYHMSIASRINDNVLEPLVKSTDEHREKINVSKRKIFEKLEEFKKSKKNALQIRSKYFTKARSLEIFRENFSEEQLNFEFNEYLNLRDDEQDKTYYIAGDEYDINELKVLLTKMITSIELSTHKNNFYITYNNVSSGISITQWVLDNLPNIEKNISKAEKFGQDLLDYDFIKTAGIGANFVNSSQYYYQWKPIVFEITKLKAPTANEGTRITNAASILEQMGMVGTIDETDITQYPKLTVDVRRLENDYKEAVQKFDIVRCQYEEIVIENLSDVQRSEFNRSSVIKHLTHEFLNCISHRIDEMERSFKNLEILEETIKPQQDLNFLIESNSTGSFRPQVMTFENYFSKPEETFGIKLSTRSDIDNRVLPFIIQAIMSYLDKTYKILADDGKIIELWTGPVSLKTVHALRFKLNKVSGLENIKAELVSSEPIAVTNVLKLYLLELPESVIPEESFALIRAIYAQNSGHDALQSRLNGLINVLKEVNTCNLATLDTILLHIDHLIKIIGKKHVELAENFKAKLLKDFSDLLHRPKIDDEHYASVATDRHLLELINDLYDYRQQIFSSIRNKSSSSSSVPNTNKPLPKKIQPSNSQSSDNIKAKDGSSDSFDSSDDNSSPAPPTPSKSGHTTLRRSTSPVKRKLNTVLTDKKKFTVVSSSVSSPNTPSKDKANPYDSDTSLRKIYSDKENEISDFNNSKKGSTPINKRDVINVD